MKQQPALSRGGRFQGGPDPAVERFTQSVGFDWRLWEQDILGSLAHAAMLEKIGVLSRSELQAIEESLNEIAQEIAVGKFQWKQELEDVHMNIEAELTRRQPAGAKLHTGRSRNDQIALDMRLWLREEIIVLDGEIRGLQRALVQLGARNCDLIIPGYTHLQRAQPVYLAHHLLAYVEMLERDRDRLGDCFHRTNVCPLGSGALAGSTVSLDREVVARLLGFVDSQGKPRLTQNSMDAVSDRDFVVEFCAGVALMGAHLSRLAEDLILWVSAEFGFATLAEAHTTGSSLMPQKKNPDVAELIRGKAGRLTGNLVRVLTLLKGLPMCYNRDLQEDKEPLFDSADTVGASLRLMAAMVQNLTINRPKCQAAGADSALLATDLADYLVGKGVPFRAAHHAVGRVVDSAEKLAKPLDRLTLAELKAVNPNFSADALEVFNIKKAMARRGVVGAPSPAQVARQLKRWRSILENSKFQTSSSRDAPSSKV